MREPQPRPRVPFGDVVHLVKDRVDPATSGLTRYVAGEHMDTNDLRLRRWGTIGADYLGPAFHMRFKPGHVLYGSRRTYLRKVAVADFEGICANTTFVLEPKDPAVLLPEFLPFVMQTEAFHDHSIKQSKGSVNPYINFSDLAWYDFPLPPPDEQRRLVEVLSCAFEVYEAHRKVRETIEQLLAAHSLEAFRALTSSGVPFEKLADLCSFGPQSGLYKGKDYYGSGIPMVHMGELFAHDVISSSTEMQLVELTDTEHRKYELTSSDLLFGRRSIVLEGAGRCVLVQKIDSPVTFESSIIRVTIDATLASNSFLFEWFNSPEGKRRISAIITFTTVAGVKGSDVARLEVPLPDLASQNTLVERISSLRKGVKAAQIQALQSSEMYSAIRNTML